MKMADVSLVEECFTHVDEVTGVHTTWAAGALYQFCVDNPDKVEPGTVPVDEEHAHFCFTHRGVEQERFAAFVQHPEFLKKPILFVRMPNGSHLLVDGTHRYVCLYALKIPTARAYVVPYDIAQPFIIEDVPQTSDEEVMAPSHIATLRALGLM
jgi:hypothetical protein